MILGASTSPHDEVVERGGYTYQIEAQELRDAAKALPEFGNVLLRYSHIFMMQIANTAMSNSHSRLDQRLARWLLMYQDRLRTADLAVTHQRLSTMLGVRRSGITETIHRLEGLRLIRARRGLVAILDRQRLQDLAAGCYGKPEREYRRLI